MAIPAGYNLVASSDLEFGTKPLMKRPVEMKHRRFLCLRRACYSLVMLALASIVVYSSFQPAHQIAPSNRSLLTLSTRMIPWYWQRETPRNVESTPIREIHIEDVVTFDSAEVLVLVQVPPRLEFPTKERIECRFGDAILFAYTKPLALHMTHANRAGILCAAPPVDLAWDVNSIRIEVDQEHAIRRGAVSPDYQHPLLWKANNLVTYDSFATERDVVVFVHGTKSSRGIQFSPDAERERLKKLRCVFDGRFETPVTSQAQEVFRCGHPPENLIPAFAGKKLSLNFDGRLLPSITFYTPATSRSAQPTAAPHHICACTMIYNGAKFLKEWVHYHSHLGVAKFFLYDNNSEDNLDDVIAALNPAFNVTKHPWPWVKTQEAGFSHCALSAEPECEWMLFVDVDEYFFPNRRFLSPQNESHLATFINEAVGKNHAKVGQISTFCHNYGPSGMTTSPPQGVTQGYTCRMMKPERHKSIVRLSAVADSLANVIHHFSLKSGHQSKRILPGVGVINHYKFQAWDEFRAKFRRRAATYVADWTENRNHESKDRVPDLGTKAVKPVDWEKRFCEVQDYGLRNYARSVFGSFDDLSKLHLAWE